MEWQILSAIVAIVGVSITALISYPKLVSIYFPLKFSAQRNYDDGTGEKQDMIALVFINRSDHIVRISKIKSMSLTQPWMQKSVGTLRAAVSGNVLGINNFESFEVGPRSREVFYLDAEYSHLEQEFTVELSDGKICFSKVPALTSAVT